MAFSLNHPALGDTSWYTPVDTNWSSLEAALTHTTGLIPFSNGSTLISNAALYWDNSNARLGLGTSGPGRKLDILDASNPQLRLTATAGSVYCDIQMDGTAGSLTFTGVGGAFPGNYLFVSSAIAGVNSYAAGGTHAYFFATRGAGTNKDSALVCRNSDSSNVWMAGMPGGSIGATSDFCIWNTSNVDHIRFLSGAGVTINNGEVDIDFRVAGSSTTYLLFTDASADRVGVNTGSPDRRLDIFDASDPQLRLTYTDGSIYTEFQTISSGETVVANTGGILYYRNSRAGTYNEIASENTNAASGSFAGFAAYVNSTTGGADPYLQLTIVGASDWFVHVDNDQSDAFAIGNTFAASTSFLSISTLGKTTLLSASTLGSELVVLGQNDTDQPFIDFQGNSAADATASISTFTTGNAVQGHIQIEINGTKRWIRFYDNPTS